MDEFKIPQIPSTSRCSFIDAVLSKEGLVATPERPPIPASPGVLQDIGELIARELPEPQRNLDGWGSVSSEKQATKQETRHRALMTGVSLKVEDLDKIYEYKGKKWNQYLKELTYWQQTVVKRIRLQYRNRISAVSSRQKKGKELDFLRKLLDEKKRQRDSHRARNRQLKARLEEVKAKNAQMEEAITKNNPKALDPVKQGFCSLEEFGDWFHPGN